MPPPRILFRFARKKLRRVYLRRTSLVRASPGTATIAKARLLHEIGGANRQDASGSDNLKPQHHLFGEHQSHYEQQSSFDRREAGPVLFPS
jgi:hypothetical protein